MDAKGRAILSNNDTVQDKAASAGKNKRKKGSIRKTVFNAVFYILIIVMLIGAFVFATNSDAKKSIFGYRMYSVMSGSMTPVHPTGSLVVVKITNPEEIKVGDDITFYNPGSDQEIWTHRVIDVIRNYNNNGVCFKTQGVANAAEDPFITLGGNVVGVVQFSIPYAGYALDFIQNNILISIVIIILAFTLIKLIATLIKPAPIKPRYGREEQ